MTNVIPLADAAPGGAGIARSDAVLRSGDVAFPDPFAALEDESPRVLAWQARMDAAARAAFAAIDGVDALADALAVQLGADGVTVPVPAGGRWFRLERDADGIGRRVRVGGDPRDHGGVLVEAADAPLDGDEAIDWIAPSPDGRLLAFGVSSHGDEQSELCLAETASGQLLAPRVRHVGEGPVVWLPDASALICCAGRGPAPETPLKRLLLVTPGAGAVPLDAPPGVERFRPTIQLSADGRWLGVATMGHFPRLLFALDRASGRWHEALPDDDAAEVFYGTFVDDEYVAVTSCGAGRGRLVAAPIDAVGDPARWRELVPEGPDAMRSVVRFGADLLLYELRDGLPRLRIVSLAGETLRQLPLPDELSIGATERDRAQLPAQLPVQVAGETLVFAGSSVRRSTTLWRYDRPADRLEELTAPSAELPGARAELLFCTAPDGEEVRYVVVRRDDLPDDGPQPALIYGYGGFDAAWTPRAYPGVFAPWVAAGGTWVFPFLRGDGTRGFAHWRAGRREHKQRTFDDLYAVTEDLVARGLASAERLALAGGSNGGLLVGGAIAQRPELFAAVAALVPVADLARVVRDRFGEGCMPEWGDPRIAAEAAWLRGCSPIHNLAPGADYPATAIVCGNRDMRTPAWHGRKLAAAMLEASGGSTPVLLRVHEDCGHLTAGMGAAPARIAEWLGFLMDAVGLAP